MKLTQDWLIRNDFEVVDCFLLCRTICDLRNAETENVPLWHTWIFPIHKNTTVVIFLQINATIWWQRLKSSQNERRSDWNLSQPKWICDLALCKKCKMQLDINSVWVQVQTRSLNPQPLIKEFPLRDLMTVCPHHYSYWWTSADTNCPGAEQIMACFTETKRPN